MSSRSDSTAEASRFIKGLHLTISSRRHGQRHLLGLRGQLDIASATALDQELKRVEATDAEQIVLDLSHLEYMDSSGLSVILAAHRRASSESDRLRLRRGPHAVQQVFDTTRTDRLLNFVD